MSATTKKIFGIYRSNKNDNDETIQRLTSVAHKIIPISYRFKVWAKKENVITLQQYIT